jgi:hypothetical protein
MVDMSDRSGQGQSHNAESAEGPVEQELTDEAGNAYTATLETAS